LLPGVLVLPVGDVAVGVAEPPIGTVDDPPDEEAVVVLPTRELPDTPD